LSTAVMTDPADAAANSLGLDLDALKIKDDPESSGSPAVPKDEEARTEASEKTEEPKSDEGAGEEAEEEEAKSPTSEGKSAEPREKKKPYVNPERVKTGGAQRDKLSEEELTLRMARIREQNEKIKQRRMDVQADEDAFKKTQEAERIKAAKTKKVQETIDRTREQNARRKMEKIQNREWDAGKPARDWKSPNKPEDSDEAAKTPRPSVGIRGAVRGGGAGRGRGRAPSTPTTEKTEKTAEEPAATPAAPAEAPAAAA